LQSECTAGSAAKVSGKMKFGPLLLGGKASETVKIINQEQLPAYYILNANAGKSFRLFKKYMLNLSLNINNILNNKTSITSGYEQLRFLNTNIDKFANKYYYMTGTTYMATINFTF
jgi:outer membrane receptor protein involved in Fe transport